jgi:hypothetical protein
MLPHVEPEQPDPDTVHVTAVFDVPVTDAVNCCVDEALTEVLLGVTDRETVAVPVPVKFRDAVLPLAEVLEIVSCPVAAPAVAGSNCTLKVVVCPGVNVRGKPDPETVKPAPVIATELTVTGAVPVDDKTTD